MVNRIELKTASYAVRISGPVAVGWLDGKNWASGAYTAAAAAASDVFNARLIGGEHLTDLVDPGGCGSHQMVLPVTRRSAGGAARPQRRGQDDDAPDHLRAAGADRRGRRGTR